MECRYDYRGRRVEKSVYEGEALVARKRFLYWNYLQIAELDATDTTEEATPILRKTYLWDPMESSATRILAMSLFDEAGTYEEDLYYTHDLLKNTTALFGIQAGRRALYEYGPYGNIIKMEGNAAEQNPFRFSSEYADDDLGLVYYNYRYFNPMDGRWTGRDPIGSSGGLNLYIHAANAAVTLYDYLGAVVSKYEGSPRALDLAPARTGQILANGRNSMPAGASGLTVPSANNHGAQISEKEVGSKTYYHLSYQAELSFNLYYNTDFVSSPDAITHNDSIYSTVREHEYHHVSLSIEWWNFYVDKFWIYDDRNYCSNDCASTMAKIILRMINMCMEEAHIENCEFDIHEYGYRNPREFARLQKEIADSKKYIETCKKEIRTYVDQYNEKDCSDDTGAVKELKYEDFID